MKYAKIDDLNTVFKILKQYKTLSHVRKDKIQNLIESKNVIFKNGVVLTFLKYKKKQMLVQLILIKVVGKLHR